MTSITTKQPSPRRMWPLAAALAVAACSQASDEGQSSTEEDGSAAEAAPAAASVSTDASGAAAAPGAGGEAMIGVAFAYRFNFELADRNVSLAQDRHVAACDRLGAARCRVTAVNYNQERGGPVTANLSFLLDPALARSFARDAVDSVEALDGSLLDSDVGGEDVGTGINASQAASANLGGDLTRIEARLRAPGLGAGERRDLAAQAEALRARLRDEEGTRRAGEARLASTPVEFGYRGTTGLAGIDRERPFASALAASSSSLAAATAFVMTLAGLVLPWALMAGGLLLAGRWLRGRLRPRPAAPKPA